MLPKTSFDDSMLEDTLHDADCEELVMNLQLKLQDLDTTLPVTWSALCWMSA